MQNQFQCGFQLSVIYDQSRTYDWSMGGRWLEGNTDKKPRPLLLAIWYPTTEQKPVNTYETYFSLTKTQSIPVIKELLQHQYHTCQKMLDLSDDDFNAFLQQSVDVIRDAKIANGRFPLIIYHPGLGGSYEENSLLCTWLAQQGYIVVSSAYQPAHGAHFTISSEKATSLADVQAIVNHMQTHPAVDWSHIALMGHSYGANVSFHIQANTGIADALISLDSTLEYPAWHSPTIKQEFANQAPQLTSPILVFARQADADFAVMKQLTYANRFFVPCPLANHDDFLAQQAWYAPNSTKTLRQNYAQLHQTIYQFLRHSWHKEADALALLIETGEHHPAQPVPPQLKSFYAQLHKYGASKAVEWCRGSGERPLITEEDLNILGYTLLQENKANDAIAIFSYAYELFPSFSTLHCLAEGYEAANQATNAITTYQKAIAQLPHSGLSQEAQTEMTEEMEEAIHKLSQTAP